MDLTLYLVTDSTGLCEEKFYEKIEQAIKGGATIVQLREKQRDSLEIYQMAMNVKKICDKYNVPLLIDDRIDIAMAVDASGVHLGQSDIPLSVARKLLPNKIIGITAKTIEQAKSAQENGADYVGVGAIFKTTTKVKTAITTIETLNEICNAISIPVVAIGGLNKDNVDVLNSSDIDGVAVVSAIMKAQDSFTAAKELKAKVINIIKKAQ